MQKSAALKALLVGEGKLSGLQREMLALTLEANEGLSLGAALTEVFDFLKIKVSRDRLEAIAQRLVKEQRENAEEVADSADEQGAKAAPTSGGFGKKLIEWVEGLDAFDRLLVACQGNYLLALKIYSEEDFTVTDSLGKLLLEEKWNEALTRLEAAAMPWSGGKGSAGANAEYVDMSKAADDDPAWAELASYF